MFTIDTLTADNDIAAKLIEKQKQYEADGFDPKKVGARLTAAIGKANTAVEAMYEPLGELNEYRAAFRMPIIVMGSAPPAKEVEKQLNRVFPWFPMGASGETLADAICIYGITSTRIGELFKTPGQTVIKKEGKKGDTLYFPAGPEDADNIAKRQVQDEVDSKAEKAKRDAKKR